MTDKTNIYTALAAAQLQMAPLVKDAKNEAFKRDGKASKYATLASVVDSVGKSLNENGITYYHVPTAFDGNFWMKTVLYHGESGTSIECEVPLLINKQDMHAYKSATTYAKRIGLESITGVAPEDDDDGNEAVKNSGPVRVPLKPEPKAPPVDRSKEVENAVKAINGAQSRERVEDIAASLRAVMDDLTAEQKKAIASAKNTRLEQLNLASAA